MGGRKRKRRSSQRLLRRRRRHAEYAKRNKHMNDRNEAIISARSNFDRIAMTFDFWSSTKTGGENSILIWRKKKEIHRQTL